MRNTCHNQIHFDMIPDKIYILPEQFETPWHPAFEENDKHDAITYIRKDALLEFINEKLQESADRLDFRTNKAYAEVLDKLNNF